MVPFRFVKTLLPPYIFSKMFHIQPISLKIPLFSKTLFRSPYAFFERKSVFERKGRGGKGGKSAFSRSFSPSDKVYIFGGFASNVSAAMHGFHGGVVDLF